MTISIPGATTSSTARRPTYVSSATKSITVVLNSPPVGYTQLAAFNVGTLPNATCPASGSDFVCTINLQIPPGSDNLTIKLWDTAGGTGNILSEQIGTFTAVVGTTNSFSVTFDANASVMTVNGSGSCQNGPVGSSFGSVGSTPVTYTVAYTDAATKTIVTPGLPTLEIQGNDAAYHSDSGTINGTGGTVAFTINQSAQTFTLTPSNSTTTNASVNVKAVPPNGGDGLSFSLTKSFAFSTGTAPPSHNFLASVGQVSSNSGEVDLFTVTLGGNTGIGSDTFSAFSPASLAVTNSTNENKPDVDNPYSLAWDTTGDLLIGNGHDGTANSGNMACVPVGAIATGANSATTVSTYVSTPKGMAYDSSTGTVALANLQPASTYNLSEYLLTGNYTAANSPPDLKVSVSNLGSLGGIADILSLTAGTFAISLTDGCEVDSAHSGGGCPASGTSEVAIQGPSGSPTTITNPTSPTTFAIDKPFGLAWDNSSNHQLVIANASAFHGGISFYSVSPVSQVKVIPTLGADNTYYRPDTWVAASPTGYIAVAQLSDFSGYPLVQIYDNTSSRNPVGGPIPFNSTSDAGCTTYIYGTDGPTINAMTWLSDTKLLIALTVTTGGSIVTAQNGLYIFDRTNTSNTPTGYNDETCAAWAAGAPQETGFKSSSKYPLGVAFKP
jgi:hypothetical protein